jgi:hypothetical protein
MKSRASQNLFFPRSIAGRRIGLAAPVDHWVTIDGEHIPITKPSGKSSSNSEKEVEEPKTSGITSDITKGNPMTHEDFAKAARYHQEMQKNPEIMKDFPKFQAHGFAQSANRDAANSLKSDPQMEKPWTKPQIDKANALSQAAGGVPTNWQPPAPPAGTMTKEDAGQTVAHLRTAGFQGKIDSGEKGFNSGNHEVNLVFSNPKTGNTTLHSIINPIKNTEDAKKEITAGQKKASARDKETRKRMQAEKEIDKE